MNGLNAMEQGREVFWLGTLQMVRVRLVAEKIIAVGRLSRLPQLNQAEFAVVVSDQWQGQGLGTELLRRLVEIGRAEKLDKITGQVLAENHAMQHICAKVGFKVVHDPESNFFNASYIC